jgi:hypothetical protein
MGDQATSAAAAST